MGLQVEREKVMLALHCRRLGEGALAGQVYRKAAGPGVARAGKGGRRNMQEAGHGELQCDITDQRAV